jgi:flagellar M-ring protein FliF
MNPLNQISKQISELIASMTPAARIMAGLMFATVVVSLGWIVSVQQNSSYEYLFGGQVMTESELKQFETAFGTAGLPDYQRDGLRIKIPSGKKDLYLKALSDSNAMPGEWGSEIKGALVSNNPFESTEMLTLRYEVGRERELARIIERMANIDYASVEYDEKRHGFARNIDRTCSVQVQALGKRAIDPGIIKNIHQMTVSYFAGLKPENVTVTDLSGSSYVGSSDPMAADNSPYLQAQMDWESKYRDQLSQLLNIYGEVKLAVAVDLDPTLKKEQEQLKFDPTVTTLESTTSKKDAENSKPTPGGRPGTEPNAISNQPQSLATNSNQQTSKTKETSENQHGVAGHEASMTTTAGLVPQAVRVTVGIPESYFGKVYKTRHPDFKETDEIPAADLALLNTDTEKKVRSAVEGLLKSVRAGEERFPLVSYYSYTDLPLPPIPTPSVTSQAVAWLADSWSTLALFGIVLMTLLMMMGWVKAQTTAPRDKEFAQGFGLEVPAIAGDELDLGEGTTTEATEEGGPKFQVTGGEMKEDLTTLIKQNPEIAVNLLRTWIGEAA